MAATTISSRFEDTKCSTFESIFCGTGGCLFEIYVTLGDGSLRSVFSDPVRAYKILPGKGAAPFVSTCTAATAAPMAPPHASRTSASASKPFEFKEPVSMIGRTLFAWTLLAASVVPAAAQNASAQPPFKATDYPARGPQGADLRAAGVQTGGRRQGDIRSRHGSQGRSQRRWPRRLRGLVSGYSMLDLCGRVLRHRPVAAWTFW